MEIRKANSLQCKNASDIDLRHPWESMHLTALDTDTVHDATHMQIIFLNCCYLLEKTKGKNKNVLLKFLTNVNKMKREYLRYLLTSTYLTGFDIEVVRNPKPIKWIC